MAKRATRRRTLPKEKKEFEEEVVQIDRVTRVVKGGRRLRFRATVVIGDKKGRVGIGVGKSNEVTGAISKAITKAKKNVVTIPLINGTIPHEIKHKFKAARILLMPAGPGTGIIAGGPIRKVVGLAGVKNILSKSMGSNNKLSCTKAAYEALKLLRENPYIKPSEDEVIEKAADEGDKGEKKGNVDGKKEKSSEKKPAKKAPAKKAAAKKQPSEDEASKKDGEKKAKADGEKKKSSTKKPAAKKAPAKKKADADK